MDPGTSCTSKSVRERRGGIESAKMLTFALDKFRLTRLTHEKCTFYIFYQPGQIKAFHMLLDSFGDSKTSLNVNTSHHRCWLELHFNEHGRKGVRRRGGIESTKTLAFAFDKCLTRLTCEEHTLGHIFYQFLAGTVPQKHDHFTPKDPSDYGDADAWFEAQTPYYLDFHDVVCYAILFSFVTETANHKICPATAQDSRPAMQLHIHHTSWPSDSPRW